MREISLLCARNLCLPQAGGVRAPSVVEAAVEQDNWTNKSGCFPDWATRTVRRRGLPGRLPSMWAFAQRACAMHRIDPDLIQTRISPNLIQTLYRCTAARRKRAKTPRDNFASQRDETCLACLTQSTPPIRNTEDPHGWDARALPMLDSRWNLLETLWSVCAAFLTAL